MSDDIKVIFNTYEEGHTFTRRTYRVARRRAARADRKFWRWGGVRHYLRASLDLRIYLRGRREKGMWK